MDKENNQQTINSQSDQQVQKSNKITRAIVGITMAVLFLLGFGLGHFFSFFAKNDMERKLEEIFEIAQDKGIEAVIDSIDTDDFAKLVVKLVLEQDEYAEYYTEEEYNQKKAQGEGSYSGIGVSLSGTKIVRVILNSPAFYAGFKANDVLAGGRAMQNEFTPFANGNDLDAFLDSIQTGEEIEFEVLRDGQTIFITVAKAEYVASYVTVITKEKAFHVFTDLKGEVQEYEILDKIENIDEQTLYLKLSSFESDATAKQFAYAMQYMKDNSLTKLLLDLRGNGGGRMTVMLDIASYLIYNDGNRSSVITYVQEKNRTSHQSTSENNFNLDISKISVIADGGSASATECIIGAMICYADKSNGTFSKDNLVIEKTNTAGTTYGKGIMQTTYQLRTGGALKLTTGKLYWPDNWTTIHKTGIKVSKDTPENLVQKGMGIERALQILAD